MKTDSAERGNRQIKTIGRTCKTPPQGLTEQLDSHQQYRRTKYIQMKGFSKHAANMSIT